MLKKISYKISILMMLAISLPALAFDLEDYATTYRATRDAYLKSINELKLATGPYEAAKDAYTKATVTYVTSLGDPEEIRRAVDNSKAKMKCLLEYKALREEYREKFIDKNYR